MLNAHQQRHVWEEWLASEMRALYFADLAGSLHRRQRAVTWAALFTSSGAVAGFLFAQGVAVWVAPLLALATAALSLYSLVAQDQQRAVESVNLHERWNRIARGYEALWAQTWAPDAEARLAALDEAAAEASKAGALFPYEKRRMLRWQDHVEQRRVPTARAAA